MNDKSTFRFATTLIILLLVVLSPQKNYITYLTLILGTLLILGIWLLDLVYSGKQTDIYDISQTTGLLLGVILTVFGMYFGQFSAPFDLGIVFGYYFLLASLVVLQGYLVVSYLFSKVPKVDQY